VGEIAPPAPHSKEQTMLLDLPLKCTIPIPISAPRARGVHSKGRLGLNMRVRVSHDDYDLITDEANKLGVPVATFIRHCSVFTAEYLRKYRDDRGKEHDNST